MPWMKLCPWDTRAVVLSSTVTLQSKDSLLQKKELMQSLKKGLISWSEERYGCASSSIIVLKYTQHYALTKVLCKFYSFI